MNRDVMGIQPQTGQPAVPPSEDALDQAQLEDWRWTYDQANAGAFDQYPNQTIAVANKRVLGIDTNPVALLERVRAEHGIPENRIILFFNDARP